MVARNTLQFCHVSNLFVVKAKNVTYVWCASTVKIKYMVIYFLAQFIFEISWNLWYKKGLLCKISGSVSNVAETAVIWNLTLHYWAHICWCYEGVPKNVASHHITSHKTGIFNNWACLNYLNLYVLQTVVPAAQNAQFQAELVSVE